MPGMMDSNSGIVRKLLEAEQTERKVSVPDTGNVSTRHPV